MQYIEISYCVESLENLDQAWAIDKAIEQIIQGERYESGMGFGWRDLLFEATPNDLENADSIEEQIEEIMEQYEIEDYNIGFPQDEPYFGEEEI